MKLIIAVTVDASSHHDLDKTGETLMGALLHARKHVNNGTRIKISSTNGEDSQAVMMLLGKLQWFARNMEKEPMRKSGWTKLRDQLMKEGKEFKKAIWEDDGL